MFDLNYLNQLIANKIEESPELEYKAAPALQNESKRVMEISKDVSSFANSSGGLIIYGMAEDQAHKQFPSNIDPINRRNISKEWLEQIINSRIRPRIHGLKIHVIVMPENQDQVVYILEIPKGDTAHQADDRRYYRRHNFTTEQLLDHEIRDIMGRGKNAEIIVDFEISKKPNLKRGGDGRTLDEKQPNSYWLNVYAENVGKVYAKYINIVLTLPQRCLTNHPYDRDNPRITQIEADNTVRDLVEPDGRRYYQGAFAKAPQYGPARYEPILPGRRMILKSIQINGYSTDHINRLSWTVYADNAEAKTGEIAFSQINQP